MSDRKLTKRELLDQQEFVMQFLKLVAGSVPREVTFNQVRVVQYIHLRSSLQGGVCNHREIASTLDIPAATVSRAVLHWLKLGVVIEKQDPEDRRKRVVTIAPRWRSLELDEKTRSLIQQYFLDTE